jgi:hypothetical protein
LTLQIGTVAFDTAGTKDSELRFVGIAAPGHAIEEAVDRAARGRRTRPPRPLRPGGSEFASSREARVSAVGG